MPASPHIHFFSGDTMLIRGNPRMNENVKSLTAKLKTKRLDGLRSLGDLQVISKEQLLERLG